MSKNLNCKYDVDPEVEFPKVEKMLYRLAWKFVKQYGIDFDDARSIAFMGFMKACRNFRYGRGSKFSTRCYLATWGQLKTYIMEQSKKNHRLPICFVEMDNDILQGEESAPGPNRVCLELLEQLRDEDSIQDSMTVLFAETPGELLELTKDLSTAAQEMLALLMEAPAGASKSEQLKTVKQLVDQQYGVNTGEQAFQEIRLNLQTVFA